MRAHAALVGVFGVSALRRRFGVSSVRLPQRAAGAGLHLQAPARRQSVSSSSEAWIAGGASVAPRLRMTNKLLALCALLSTSACAKQDPAPPAKQPRHLTTSFLERMSTDEQDRVLGISATTSDRVRALVGPDDLVLGLADAPVVLVGFVDVASEHGGPALDALREIATAHPLDVRVVLKPMANLTSPISIEAANLVAAATEIDRGWDAASCLASEVELVRATLDECAAKLLPQDRVTELRTIGSTRAAAVAREVDKLAVTGAPTLFLNGHRIKGLPPSETLANGVAIAVREAKTYAMTAGLQRGAVYPALMRHAGFPERPRVDPNDPSTTPASALFN